MIQKLKRKFFWITATALALVILLVLGAINSLNYFSTARRADEMLRLLASHDGSLPKFDKGRPEPPAGPGDLVLNADTRFKTRYFIVWLDDKSEVIRIDTSHIAAISSEEAMTYGRIVATDGSAQGFQGIYRFRFEQTALGKMVIFLDCSTELQGNRDFLLLSCGMGLLAFFLVAGLALLLSRRAIRPAEEAMEKQRQFLTDASHELKTPLSIISANNDVMELTVGQTQWSESIRSQVCRMDHLLQSMLALSRLEGQKAPYRNAPFSLSEVVEHAVQPFSILAQKTGVSLASQIDTGIFYAGDSESIQHLVSILLENAVKYAGPQGKVTLRLTKAGKAPRLEVENTCQELPQGDLNQLFNRFYRADTARSRETGGYGIGLAIAQSICQAHHMKLSASIPAESRIRFTVHF